MCSARVRLMISYRVYIYRRVYIYIYIAIYIVVRESGVRMTMGKV